jgi:hypothetical protein
VPGGLLEVAGGLPVPGDPQPATRRSGSQWFRLVPACAAVSNRAISPVMPATTMTSRRILLLRI